MKLMALALLLAGVATGIKSDSALLVMGCGASIVFGFLLDIYHAIAKNEQMSKRVIFAKSIVAVSFSYGVFIFWMAYYGTITFMLIAILWLSSLMASVFTEMVIGISKVGFKSFFKTILQKLLSNMDSREEQP